MSYETYKILHLIGVFSLFLALGALLIQGNNKQTKKNLMMLHGIAVLILFVTGFGLLARLDIFRDIPTWAILKIGIWLILGIVIPILLSLKFNKTWLWLIVWFSGLSSVFLAITKMFP